jgi:hypothetical protein
MMQKYCEQCIEQRRCENRVTVQPGLEGGMVDRQVWLGSSEWLRPEWLAGFYPSGMPAEWRLSYYNTQFSCIWLPCSAWRGLSLAVAEEWVADTRAEFRFLLEAGVGMDSHETALLEVLAPRLGLHCAADHPDLLWFDSSVDLRSLAAALKQRPDGVTYPA